MKSIFTALLLSAITLLSGAATAAPNPDPETLKVALLPDDCLLYTSDAADE